MIGGEGEGGVACLLGDPIDVPVVVDFVVVVVVVMVVVVFVSLSSIDGRMANQSLAAEKDEEEESPPSNIQCKV